MNKFDEQLKRRRTILDFLREEPKRYQVIIDSTSQKTGTSQRSLNTLRWLVDRGYVKRIERGLYGITATGLKFLTGIRNSPNSDRRMKK